MTIKVDSEDYMRKSVGAELIKKLCRIAIAFGLMHIVEKKVCLVTLSTILGPSLVALLHPLHTPSYSSNST